MSNARNLANLLGTSTTVPSSKQPAGSILQVITSNSNAVSSIDSETYADIPAMTATITPRATSSKILIQVSFGILSSTGASVGCLMKLFRNSTEIGSGSGADTMDVFLQNFNGDANEYDPRSHMFVDSPSSTSALTYKLQWRVVSAGGGETWYMNRRGNTNYSRTQSTFYVMEIAG